MTILAATVAGCLLAAAQTHSLAPSLLFTLLHVEGGRIGEISRNSNGSVDIGPMQVNSIWLPQVASRWKTDTRTAYTRLLTNPCDNIETGAWILRGRIDATGDLGRGIAAYHSFTPRFGTAYLQRVVAKSSEIDKRLSAAGIVTPGTFLAAIQETPIGTGTGASSRARAPASAGEPLLIADYRTANSPVAAPAAVYARELPAITGGSAGRLAAPAAIHVPNSTKKPSP
jgi:hypothetical protein